MLWSGTLYSSGSITGTSNSGWLDLKDIAGAHSPLSLFGVLGGRFTLVTSGASGVETLTASTAVATQLSGSPQWTGVSWSERNNGNSWATTHAFLDKAKGEHQPQFWRISWAISGTLSFEIQAVMELGVMGN